MKSEIKMRLITFLSLLCLCSSRNANRNLEHKFVTSFVVTPDRRDGNDERKSREIVEIIPDATTVSTLSHYPIDCTNEKECDAANSGTTPMPTFRPYSQEELNSFLKKYVEENGKTPEAQSDKLSNVYMDEAVNVLDGTKEKSKSWQLMQSQSQSQSQTNNRPYDDRTGWVTLEPVPWSASQIQKWEPNKRPPQIPQWDEQDYKPNKWQERPWNKPTYEYKPSPQQKPYEYNKPSWADNYGSGSDIITDNRPSSFPQESYNKPSYSSLYKPQDSHERLPGDGDGRWVLLSSTKGYSHPQRSRAYQRSIVLPSGQKVKSVKSHRSVKLTVLPSENNTTITHDGLIEVERSSQTVDESQREHAAKMLKLTQPTALPIRRAGRVRVYPIQSHNSRNNAVLAAVGAGMIPATMAMLLPMVLGRRKRSAEPVYIPQVPYKYPIRY